MSDFRNRLKKTWPARQAWAAREPTQAFRVYDLDLPDWPYAVDWYGGWLRVVEYPSRKQRRDDGLAPKRAEVLAACAEVLEVPPAQTVLKRHEPVVWGEAAEPPAGPPQWLEVEEHGLRFSCDLMSHFDTGLFLDHRPLRARVRREAAGRRVLNLFAYTGAFTVHARAGGAAETTTVDLSQTACSWAEKNLALNRVAPSPKHQVVRADVLAWLERAKGPYDLVVLDPPSFSTSKKMARRFEVQRDHVHLVDQVRRLLAPGGVLYFSTNFLEFELDAALAEEAEALDTLPKDFRRQVHRTWRFGA